MAENGPLLEEILSSNGLEVSPEQDTVKVTEHLQGGCCSSSSEEQLIAACWALVSIYQTLLFTRQHPQGKEEESRATGTVATQTAAEPQEQPVLAAVTPIQKQKSKTKSVSIERDTEEAGPPQQEEEAGLEIITQPLCPGELRCEGISAASQVEPLVSQLLWE